MDANMDPEHSQDYEEPIDEDVQGIFNPGTGGMNPSHPLMQRAQEALKRQLVELKRGLEENVRGKANELKTVKKKREDVGVELYGFQQNLANLQRQLEKTHETYVVINKNRLQAEEQLQKMQEELQIDVARTKEEEAKVGQFQKELDKQAVALRQIEQYNEQMKSDIAVTRRAAYAAEEAVQKLEKEKLHQDFLIDSLQDTVKNLNQQLSACTTQLENQKRETRGAMETLAEAEGEMESIHFEKKQLVVQWKASINANQKREEALAAIQESMNKQLEQELVIETEIEGYQRDIAREQLENEQLTSELRKLKGEAEHLETQIEASIEREERLQDMLSKLSGSLEQTEEQMKQARTAAKALATESNTVGNAAIRVTQDMRQLEEETLSALREQTTAERSAQKTAQDAQGLRKRIRDEEVIMAEAQNELAKMQVDILNTQAHNERLTETVKLLDEELKGKERAVMKYESEIRQQNDEIEKKTREVAMLNKRYEKVTKNMTQVEVGPLEATINNVQKEIEQKNVEGKEMQKRWIGFQAELVTLQHDNNKLTETVSRLKAEHTVLQQKRLRLDQQCQRHQVDIKKLQSRMAHLRVDLQRVNAMIAQNSSLKALLAEDNFNLENKTAAELKTKEEESVRTQSQIEQVMQQKRDTMSEIMEIERQILLWERKIQLEREMQQVLDPALGQDVIGTMRKEIHRMKLRHAELMKLQEKLISEMERSLVKRELMHIKHEAMDKKKSLEMTEAQLKKACLDMQKSIRETEQQMELTDNKLSELDEARGSLAKEMEALSNAVQGLQLQQEELRACITEFSATKVRLLLITARTQKALKRLEDVDAGKYKRLVEDDRQVAVEVEKAREKHSKIIAAVEALKVQLPGLDTELERVLCHVAVH